MKILNNTCKFVLTTPTAVNLASGNPALREKSLGWSIRTNKIYADFSGKINLALYFLKDLFCGSLIKQLSNCGL